MKTLLLSSVICLLSSIAAFAGDSSPRPSVSPGRSPTGDTVIRDENGKIVNRIDRTATGTVIRDENGKIVGRIDRPDPKK